MNFKIKPLKIILSIIIPIIVFYLLFGFVILSGGYSNPINYIKEIILLNDFTIATQIWIWQISIMILTYIIWSFFDK